MQLASAVPRPSEQFSMEHWLANPPAACSHVRKRALQLCHQHWCRFHGPTSMANSARLVPLRSGWHHPLLLAHSSLLLRVSPHHVNGHARPYSWRACLPTTIASCPPPWHTFSPRANSSAHKILGSKANKQVEPQRPLAF